MTTPPINRSASKRHARTARVGGHSVPTQLDRQGLLTFARNGSVYFKFLRNSYSDTEWGSYLRETMEGTKWREFLDKLFKYEEPTT